MHVQTMLHCSQSNIDAVDGIVLFGSYLTDFLMDTDNKFGVPALTLVGTLDGLTLSYVYRYKIT